MNKSNLILLFAFLINVLGYGYYIRKVSILEDNYSDAIYIANKYEYLFNVCKTVYKGGK